MRLAVVDNATLTACQRLLGDISVANLHNIDGDIVALEGLLQAILFYDRIYYLNDYKEEYREGRQRRFPFLHRIDLERDKQNELEAASLSLTSDFITRIEAGEISTPALKEFLEKIGLHFIFAWHMQSSEFFLVTKLLGGHPDFDLEKHSKLMAMIATGQMLRNRSTSTSHSDEVKLISSSGEDVSEQHKEGNYLFKPGDEVERFAANLNWLTQRTTLYGLLSSNLGGDPILHPIRHGFSLSFAAHKLGLSPAICSNIIERLKLRATSTLSDVKSASDPTIIHSTLPLFTAWVAQKCSDPVNFLTAALELRGHTKIAALRNKLAELEGIKLENDELKYVKAVNMLCHDINRSTDGIRSEFSVTTANGIPLAPVVSILNATLAASGAPVNVPNLGLSVPGGSRIRTSWQSRGYRGLFRSVILDLSAVSQFGSLHERITSRVRRKKDAQFADVKIEEAHLRFASPHWKRPM